MEFLLTLDRLLFLRINHLPHTPVPVWIAQFFSVAGSAGVIWLVIGGYLFIRDKRKDHGFFVPIGATLIACLIFVEGLVKYIVARPRPDIADGARIIGWAHWFSFPSSHAAISWAMAYIMCRYEPRGRIIWFVLAGLISFSRIYLGVHFPLDVLAGSIIGWGIGRVSYAYFSPRRQIIKRKQRKSRT